MPVTSPARPFHRLQPVLLRSRLPVTFLRGPLSGRHRFVAMCPGFPPGTNLVALPAFPHRDGTRPGLLSGRWAPMNNYGVRGGGAAFVGLENRGLGSLDARYGLVRTWMASVSGNSLLCCNVAGSENLLCPYINMFIIAYFFGLFLHH